MSTRRCVREIKYARAQKKSETKLSFACHSSVQTYSLFQRYGRDILTRAVAVCGVHSSSSVQEFGADEGKVRLFVSEVSDGFFGRPDTTLSGVESALIVDEVIGIHYDYEYYRVLMGVPYKDTLR